LPFSKLHLFSCNPINAGDDCADDPYPDGLVCMFETLAAGEQAQLHVSFNGLVTGAAKRLLARDVDNLQRFLARFVPGRCRPYAEEPWALYESGQLTAETRLRGEVEPPRKQVEPPRKHDETQELLARPRAVVVLPAQHDVAQRSLGVVVVDRHSRVVKEHAQLEHDVLVVLVEHVADCLGGANFDNCPADPDDTEVNCES
jgi:hypothetical protein